MPLNKKFTTNNLKLKTNYHIFNYILIKYKAVKKNIIIPHIPQNMEINKTKPKKIYRIIYFRKKKSCEDK